MIKNQINKVLWLTLLALTLSYLLAIAFNIDFTRNILSVSDIEQYVIENSGIEFADIDGDGNDECILARVHKENGFLNYDFQIMSIDKRLRLLEQVPLSETSLSDNRFFTTDYNYDRKEEIFIITVDSNKLFLEIYEYNSENHKYPQYPKRRYYLDTFIRYKGGADLSITHCYTIDENGDGIGNVYFKIRNGYNIYPRKIYKLNLLKNDITSTPAYCYSFVLSDTLLVNNNLIFTTSSGSDGNDEPLFNYPYSDYYSYSLLLNNSLNPILGPIKRGYFPSSIQSFFLGDKIIEMHSDSGGISLVECNLNGKVVNQKKLRDSRCTLKEFGNIIYLNTNDNIYEVVENLEFKRIYSSLPNFRVKEVLDLNGDGENELISLNFQYDKLQIIEKRSKPIIYPIDFNKERIMELYFLKLKGKNLIAVLDSNNKLNFYQYKLNQFFWLKYPYYIGLFLLSFLLIFLLYEIQNKRQLRIVESEKKIIRLQLLTLKNKVDPHFTLNALNSIDGMYKAGDQKKAESYMVSFSRLIHQTLMSSDKITSSLKDELDFVRHYCKLEEYKSNNQFQFEIIVEEDLDINKINLPRHLIFTYVENAIKHGLRPLSRLAKLNINVKKEEGVIVIIINDNGIGFKNNQHKNIEGTKQGLAILIQIIDLYREISGVKIKVMSENKEFEPGVISTISFSPLLQKQSSNIGTANSKLV